MTADPIRVRPQDGGIDDTLPPIGRRIQKRIEDMPDFILDRAEIGTRIAVELPDGILGEILCERGLLQWFLKSDPSFFFGRERQKTGERECPTELQKATIQQRMAQLDPTWPKESLPVSRAWKPHIGP